MLLFFHIYCPVLKYVRLVPSGIFWEPEIRTIYPIQWIEVRAYWRLMIGKSPTVNKYNWSRISSRNQSGAFDHLIHTKLLMCFYKFILLRSMQYYISIYFVQFCFFIPIHCLIPNILPQYQCLTILHIHHSIALEIVNFDYEGQYSQVFDSKA